MFQLTPGIKDGDMRSWLEKAHDLSSIGTFILTVIVVFLMVEPLLKPAQQSAGQNQETQKELPNSAPTRRFSGWVLPSALAFSLVLAGGLHLMAARANARSRQILVDGRSNAFPMSDTEQASGDALQIIEARPELVAPDANLTYRRKLRVILRNASQQHIEVSTPDWISSRSSIPFQPPFWSLLDPKTGPRGDGNLASGERKLRLLRSRLTLFAAPVWG
jgi:hypothetical protein